MRGGFGRLTTSEDPADIREFVLARLAELDTTPRDRYWRRNALGMTKAEAIADAPRFGRLDLRITLGEIRVLRSCATRRGMTLRPWLRAALATAAIACEGVAAEEIPTLAGHGLLGPR